MEKSLSILFGILLISNSAIAQSVQVNSGTTENLASIVFTDSLNAYCVGTNGIILHSSDAGENWVKQNYEDSITFVSIEAFSTDSLIALGFDNRNSKIVLCTTENAGL